MKHNSTRWNKTKDAYLDWLSKTELRKIFNKKLKINNFSVWWATKLVDKNIMTNNFWYYQLNSVLNNEKPIINKNYFLYISLTLKLFKKLFISIIYTILINILYGKKNTNTLSNKLFCFHSNYINIVPFKKTYIDRQYGLATTKNKIKSCYLIKFENAFNTIFDCLNRRKELSKISIDYFILNKYISLKDILKIYFQTFFLLVKLLFILRKKNYFIIKNKDCSFILQPLLINSFFGSTQDSLIQGIAIKNFFGKENYKNFITYGEFFSGFRSAYYFVKKNLHSPKVVSINHGIFSENNLSYALRKDEFNKDDNNSFYSPKPDIFLTQGFKYLRALKKILPYKKVHPIGSFKYEMADYTFNKPFIKKKVNLLKKKLNKKYVVAICTAINDETNIINFLNKCSLENCLIILCPHPYFVKTSSLIFKNNFKYKFEVMRELSTREITSSADCIITGMSSVGLEFLIKNLNVLKVIDDRSVPLQELNDGIPIAKNYKDFNKYLKRKPYLSKSSLEKIKKNFFYKFDNKTNLRFWKILNRI